MSASAEIQIGTLPLDILPQMLPSILPLLERGIEVATNVDLAKELADVEAGLSKVWVVVDGGTIRAAMLTSIVIDEYGERALDVYGMAGEGIAAWGKPLSRRLYEFAKAESCRRAVFYGRKALLRVYEGVSIVGKQDDRTMIFERVIQ